jgi:hypothetical protein
MGIKRTRLSGAAVAASLLVAVVISRPASAVDGTWELYPAQGSVYATAVQQPINPDGSSSWPGKRGVIPVKFSLSASTGPVVFESIGSDTVLANDFSYVSFTPSSPMTFGDITALSAAYSFTLGDCHGGSLRWQVRTSPTQALFIYYGNPPQFGNGGDGGCLDQSDTNLVGLTDLRYDTSQYAGGTFYDTYDHALAILGTTPIIRASLVLDSGWGGDQRLTLGSATVNDNTFVPLPSGTPVATCDLPPAAIRVTKISPLTGPVSEPASIQPADGNLLFRIVDCKYIYNLDVSTLLGSGFYQVEAVINGTSASGEAFFALK